MKSLALAVAEILHGVQNSKTGYLTLTTPLSGKIFFGRVGRKLMYQIRSLWVHPLRSYEWWCKMQKMRWFGVLMGALKVMGNATIR